MVAYQKFKSNSDFRKILRDCVIFSFRYNIISGLNPNKLQEMYNMFRIAEDIVTHAIQNDVADTVQFLKQTFKPDFDVATLKADKIKHVVRQKANLDFFFQFDDYMKSKQGTVTKGTMDVFKNLRLILKTFETYRKEAIKFNSIDINFYEEFVHYLSFEHIWKIR